MIATLVVQPPSTHEAGDLVVYRDGEVTYRHDFGKADGTAAYVPHYAVHYADSEHALEQVTKGYRLVLVYSICLPATMRHLERRLDKPLSESLAKAIGTMDDENDSFALLFNHEYTEKSIRDLGSGALKGVDSARFHVLEGANALIQNDDGSERQLEGHKESITWFSTTGEELGPVKKITTKLNFLNPEQATVSDLWIPFGACTKEGGFMGNESSSAVTTYSRFAIVAWLATKHPEITLTFMPLEVAAEAHRTENGHNAVALLKFLDAVSARLEAENSTKSTRERKEVDSLTFCRTLCEVLLDTRGSKLVAMFLKTLSDKVDSTIGNGALVQPITNLVRVFDWSDIGEAVLYTLGGHGGRETADEDVDTGEDVDYFAAIEMTLRAADGVDAGAALDSLVKMAVEHAEKIKYKALLSSNYIGFALEDNYPLSYQPPFLAMVNKLKTAEPGLLGPSIQYITQYVDNSDEKDEKFAVVASIVSNRIDWLKTQIEKLDKPFTWECLT